MNNISEQLMKYTAENSNFQVERDYISMSHSVLPLEEIQQQVKLGFTDTIFIRLKCYKGYQMEADLLNRIKTVYGDRIKTNVEITAFNGKVKGHPDFTFDGFPSDCKSVLMDTWLPKGKMVPKKVYWQMQAYMLYSNKDNALVVYESRESGHIKHIWLNKDINVQEEIDRKFKSILNNG